MALKRIFLIRHGETDYNIGQIVQGRLIDSDLNKTGKLQRDLLYQEFLGVQIDHIYLSTLKRTFQTMEPLIQKGIPHSCEPELDELCFGNMEGTPIFDAEGNSRLKEVLAKWKNGDYNERFIGGESPIEGLARVKKGLKKILKQDQEGQIIICLHQRILRIVLCYLLDKPLSDMDNYPHHNAGISTFEYNSETKKITLLELNNHLHVNIPSLR